MNCPDCGTPMKQIPYTACPGFISQSDVPADWVYCPRCEDGTEKNYYNQLEACFDSLDYVCKCFSLVFADAIMYLAGEVEMSRDNLVDKELPVLTEYWTVDPWGGTS